MNTKTIGNKYEQIVADFLTQKGFTVVERNYRCQGGEIDIISVRGGELHITEVKKIPASWSEDEMRYKITFSKILRIKRTCSYYLAHSCKYKYDTIVFDVSCVCGNKIHYWEGAFE